jgi:hypothetical protein
MFEESTLCAEQGKRDKTLIFINARTVIEILARILDYKNA